MDLMGKMGMNTRNLRFRSNRVRDIMSLFHKELDGMYGSGEVGVFLDMLFEAYLGWNRVRLLMSKEQTIDQSDLLRFHWALEDLKRHRPVQHIVGHVDFCGCRLEVNPDVLIPRPETEEIVNWIIDTYAAKKPCFNGTTPTTYDLRLRACLDLCTGSGCIAIALKRAFPQAAVAAVDLSEAALAVARRNAEANGTAVDFRQADVLDPQFDLGTSSYDLIVSNPPYVRASERQQMAANVLDYEPHMALFVPDDDPLRFYDAATLVAKRNLAPGGMMVLEINEALASDTCQRLAQQGFHTRVHTDFRGKERWIEAWR